MATNATLVSVEEYLRLSDKPAFEYKDGLLSQKRMPTRKHSRIQFRINQLIEEHFAEFEAGPELTVRVRPDRYLVPDVAVQRRDHIQDPYPTDPIPLCVEVLSPDDRMSEVLAKCEEYHAWGVPMIWIVDPDARTAWEFPSGGRLHEVPAEGSLVAAAITVSLTDIFAVLD